MKSSEQGNPAHRHVQEHIELIARHEEEFLARRTKSQKLGDGLASLVGSLKFVSVNIVFFAAWIAWNALPTRSLPQFDPFPFPLLDLVLAFEAILIASFIVMRQSRIGRRNEERDHLMLQVILLIEKEMTAVLGVNRQVAETVGLEHVAADRDIAELSQHTSIDEVARGIQESLPGE